MDANQHTLIFFIDKASPVIDDLEKSNIRYVRRILTYTTQPDYLDPTLTRGDTHLPELDLRDEHYLLLVYLDVWQRHISSLDDQRIREVALAGPDTTTRIQTLWQVKILPITLPGELLEKIQEDADKSRNINFKDLEAVALQTAGEARQRYETLNRLEQEIMEQFNTLTCTASYSEWDALSPHDPGTLKATTSSTDDTEDPEYSGYWGQENQLYRVEIHEGTEDALHPTFKWARNNASVLAQGKVNDTKVTIDSTGQSGILCFQTGQWIEVVTAQTELNTKPGTLLKITNADTTTSQLTLASSLPEGEKGADITLRLWDGKENIGRSGQWIPLEGGIKIQFSEGTYKSGDYWLIPARMATKEIEWPPYQVPNTEPAALLPHGIQHHYTRLARVRRYRARHYNHVSVRDCRRHFSPLPDSADALHIVRINWRNGETYPRHFLKEGLHITLDAELDPRYTRAMSPSMIVTLETALPGGGKGLFVMNGTFEIKSNVIS